MRVALVNIGTIVSGDLNAPFAKGDTIITDGDRIVAVGTASASEVEACDVVIDADRTTAIPGLIDLARAHHVRRFHAAAADGRLSGKLRARRGDDRDQRVGSPCPRPAAGCRRRKGARRRRAKVLRALPAGRDEGLRRLGHSRADAERQRPGRDREEGRVAGKGGFRRLQDRVRVYAARRRCARARHDHHLPHRRLVDPRLRRDHRRSSARDEAACVVPCERRADRHARQGLRADHRRRRHGIAGLHRGQPAHRAPVRHAGPAPSARSIVSSWRPTRRPEAASCRSACSTPCRISRASAGIAPELCIAAATGSNARVYRLDSGLLAAGKAADIVLLDAPDGGTQDNALAAIRNGDIAAVGAVITGGRPRFVGRSRNTPATTRTIRVASCKLRRSSRACRISRGGGGGAGTHARAVQARDLSNNAA